MQNNRILAFNEDTGILTCESGLLINDICNIIHKKGFILPVVPGSGFVSIGGAVSNDVHGKSHHSNGSFANHVTKLLVCYKGKSLNCSKSINKELFKSVVGGMGLIGEIRSVTLRLKKSKKNHYLVESIPYKTLDDFFLLSEKSDNFSDTVAWFDCMSKNYKGVFFRANLVKASKRKNVKKNIIKYPFSHGFSLINKQTIILFNTIYYYMHFFKKKKIQSFYEFHQPLDSIKDWNKIYGSKGFYQFQGVIPKRFSKNGSLELLKKIKESGQGSFLSVLKNFGPKKSLGILSFPIEGTTIAIDFPNKGQVTKKLVNDLYQIVIKYGGRIYPAKDALMTSKQFRQCYPDFNNFLKLRDPSIQSLMSKRFNI